MSTSGPRDVAMRRSGPSPGLAASYRWAISNVSMSLIASQIAFLITLHATTYPSSCRSYAMAKKTKRARQVGAGEPLSLRFLPRMKRQIEERSKAETVSVSAFATSVCRRYLDKQLVLIGRPRRLPGEGRVGTSVKLDPEVERRLANDFRVVEWEWELAYLVRRLLEWHVDGLLVASAAAPLPTAAASSR